MKPYVINVGFVSAGQNAPANLVLSRDSGGVYLGAIKSIDEKLVLVDIVVEWEKDEYYVSIDNVVSKIEEFVTRYGSIISKWRETIQEVLDNRETLLVDELTVSDFQLSVTLDEFEGIMLCSDCMLFVLKLYDIQVELSEPSAESLACVIRQQCGVE